MPATISSIEGVPLATIERLNRDRSVRTARYEEDGCCDRFDYLCQLAADHGLALGDVIEIADLLGPEEDFDGLITTLEDFVHSL